MAHVEQTHEDIELQVVRWCCRSCHKYLGNGMIMFRCIVTCVRAMCHGITGAAGLRFEFGIIYKSVKLGERLSFINSRRTVRIALYRTWLFSDASLLAVPNRSCLSLSTWGASLSCMACTWALAMQAPSISAAMQGYYLQTCLF